MCEKILLEKYKQQREFKKVFEIEIDGRLTDNEIDELLSKLKDVGLIDYRDAATKNRIRIKIKNEYNNDSFISLLQLITDGHHVNDLISAYNQLSKDAQNAFLFTALIHQFKLSMPA